MAMPRSRGVRLFTTPPPMRISPEVGVSRPAIIRSRVVFPEPEGPRRTRNSPSLVSRLMLFTAPSVPALKTLVRFLISTTAIEPPGNFHLAPLFPAGEDAFVLRFGGLDGVFRGFVATSDFREHGGDHPGLEGLVNRRAGIARVADVGGPVEHVAEDFVFVSGVRARIAGDFFFQ